MKSISVIIALLFLAADCERTGGPDTDWNIGDPVLASNVIPVFLQRDHNEVYTLKFDISGSGEAISLQATELTFSDGSAVASLASVSVWYNGVVMGPLKHELLGTTASSGKTMLIEGDVSLSPGVNTFVIDMRAKPGADLTGILELEGICLSFSNKVRKKLAVSPDVPATRFGIVLRAAQQDGSDTYRIPGIATTRSGSLIAVYDIRYNNSKDLQEDIDVGMSRSTDGGITWEPMKIIMNMGEYGGRPEAENGIGDPCVLVDETTGTIWVAALWLHGFPGQAAWNASGPGTDPAVTGQFMVVKSDDDGLTWSQEINLTPQIKKPEWRLMLQGPGNGITLDDGTIVFPAQFRDASGLPHSTIIFSADHGITWKSGTGARGNTTEAQCVQLSDGSLMLNMRDNRNSSVKDNTNGRAVSVTNDLGTTWVQHPSSNSALPEPVCMASIIAADLIVGGVKRKVLFFSNPDDKNERTHMTIKASLDEGLSWPEEYSLELYRPAGFGYSCLTMTDDNTLGILYEGTKDLFFQKIPVDHILTR